MIFYRCRNRPRPPPDPIIHIGFTSRRTPAENRFLTAERVSRTMKIDKAEERKLMWIALENNKDLVVYQRAM
jgi:hypothetical protein